PSRPARPRRGGARSRRARRRRRRARGPPARARRRCDRRVARGRGAGRRRPRIRAPPRSPAPAPPGNPARAAAPTGPPPPRGGAGEAERVEGNELVEAAREREDARLEDVLHARREVAVAPRGGEPRRQRGRDEALVVERSAEELGRERERAVAELDERRGD